MSADNANNDPLYKQLTEIGGLSDSAIDLAETALLLASVNHPGISFDRYRQHLRKSGEDVRARYDDLLEAGAQDNAETQIAALKNILVDALDFRAPEASYDDLENADLMRVIDRRQGMPIALCILYIDAGRRAGFNVSGLGLPGHFILRMDKEAQRVIFDPFQKCKLLQAPDLRAIVKQYLGANAELSAQYYEPCTNRSILLRLQNNIKLRLIEAEEYEAALAVVERMRLIDPDEYRLLLDAGVLYARTGRQHTAVDVLESYLTRAPVADHHDALLLLRHIRTSLN